MLPEPKSTNPLIRNSSIETPRNRTCDKNRKRKAKLQKENNKNSEAPSFQLPDTPTSYQHFVYKVVDD